MESIPLLELAFLGAPEITINGQLADIKRRKAVALLAYLAVTNQRHQRDTLATLFWPQLDEKQARANLRYTLWTLRQSLGDELLEVDRQSIGLRSGFKVDTERFMQNVKEAKRLGNADENLTISLLEETVSLYRDSFLAGFTLRDAPDFDEWQFFQTQHYYEHYTLVLQSLTDIYSQQKRWSDAIACTQKWLALDFLHEPAHRKLMELYVSVGRKTAALRQYETCCQHLDEELGLDPQAETTALYKSIRNHQVEESEKVQTAYAQKDDLTAETISDTPDFSLKSIPDIGALPPKSYIPLRNNLLFVGRTEDLYWLADKLKQRSSQAVALTGLGGVGKTQLAVEFAYRYGRFFSGGVFWLNCSEPETIPAQIARFGNASHMALHADFDEFKQTKQVALVQQAWQQEIPRLLIFDACEDEAILTKWQPKGGGCRILLTSRRGQWSLALGIITRALMVISREESVQLLRQFQETLTPHVAVGIAAELGDLPLALHLAGSFLRTYQHEVSPADYLAELRDWQGRKLLEHPSLQGRGTNGSPTKHEMHLARTFTLSYEQMDLAEDLDASAWALLSRAACFASGEPIPRHLLKSTAALVLENCKESERALWFTDALARLLALGLINENPDGTIYLHRLITEFVLNLMDAEAQSDVEEAVLNEAERLSKDHRATDMHSWQVHLHHITDRAWPRQDLLAAQLNHELGAYLLSTGEYEAASAIFEQTMSVLEAVVGIQHASTARCLNNLGCTLKSMGAYENAHMAYEKALSIREDLLGPDHQDTAESSLDLSILLYELAKYEEAWAFAERASLIWEKRFGPEHPKTARSLVTLGVLQYAQGNYDQALSIMERALKIQEKTLGRNDIHLASSLNNLGMIHIVRGEFAIARIYYERALELWESVDNPNTSRTATALVNLSELLLKIGEYESAQRYAEQALAIWEKSVGPLHQYVAYPLLCLGKIFVATGDFGSARSYLERAVAIRESAVGFEHPLTAESWVYLGQLLQKMGDKDAALSYYEEALAVQEQTLAADHLETSDTLHSLGTLLQVTGCWDQAQAYFERALAIREAKLGVNHPDTIEARNQLASLHL